MSEQQNLKELSDFIDSNPDPREQKRAIAVMMWIEGVPCSKIQKILNVSAAFISQCKARFIKNGVEDLRLKYQGSKAYLNQLERTEIIKYLDAKEFFSLQELREYIEDKYDVRFKSHQSYYQLLDEAEISWKKTQKKNPKKNDKLVEKKKIEIEKILEENREEIEAGRLVVYMIDECHLPRGRCLWICLGKDSDKSRSTHDKSKRKTNIFWRSQLSNKTIFCARIWSRKFRKYSFVCKIPSKSKYRSENFDILGWGKLS